MTMSTRVNALALSLAVLSTAGLVFAQPSMDSAVSSQPAGAHKMHHKGCGIFKQLGLSEEQRQKLKTQHEAFRQENATLISDMRSKFQQLRQLPKTPESQSQRAALRADLKKDKEALHSKHLAMLQQVLTPDQMQQYEAAKAKCKAEWRAKHPKSQGEQK